MASDMVGAWVLIFDGLKTENRRDLAVPNTLAVCSGVSYDELWIRWAAQLILTQFSYV